MRRRATACRAFSVGLRCAGPVVNPVLTIMSDTSSNPPSGRRPGSPRKVVPSTPPIAPGQPTPVVPPAVLHLHARDYEPRGLLIGEFCAAYGICRHTYISLRKAGLGPAELKPERRVVVASFACLEWEAAIRNRSLLEE